jgi:hypothetical protein
VDPNAHKRKGKWTYQRLSESEPLEQLTFRLISNVREKFKSHYEASHRFQKFEILLLVDNSGSMSAYEHHLMESLVMLMESLRRLECSFAVARFGAKSGLKTGLLKKFDTPFTYLLGERIIESFSFDEGTTFFFASFYVCFIRN